MLGLLACIWGSGFSFIKVGVETIPPFTLATGRIVVAGIFLFACVRFKGDRIPWNPRHWGLLFLIGFFANVLPFTLISWGEQRIDSGLAAILMAISPLITIILLQVFTSDEPLTVIKSAGVSVGFAGVVVLVGAEAISTLGGNVWHQLAVAGGAVSYALGATLTRRLPPIPTLAASTICMLLAAVQIIPLAIIIERPWTIAPSAASAWSVLYLGLFPTGLAAIIYFHLIAARGATYLSLSNYAVPALGVIYGMTFLDERLSAQAFFALALILAGIAVANWSIGRRRSGPGAKD